MTADSPGIPTKTRDHAVPREDSTRWDRYRARNGDVVVATYPKCGTTWMEHVVLHLRHHPRVPNLYDVAPWIEIRGSRGDMGTAFPVEELCEWMEAMPHPRQIKSHLPLDFLPYSPDVRYLVVGRDMRDAYPSWHSHLGRLVPDLGDLRSFWSIWLAKGADVPGDGMGGSHAPAATADAPHPHFQFYHSWLQYRHLDNILLVHFADLLAGLQSEIRRVAKFLDIRADDGVVDAVAKATTFSSMKANAERLLDTYSFLVNKGTNGRWREVLTDDDLVLYENAKTLAKESGISAECLAWLESGNRAGEP